MKNGWLVAMGAAAAGAVAGLASTGVLHKAAVATTCAGMKVAAVADRMAALEADIRAEVTAKVDAEGAEA